MRIDYIVVAYRSAGDLGACLDSIAGDRPAGSRVIVVDNASPDDSGAIARRHSVGAQLITSDRNLGFGGGCNLAARQSKADLLFFLNPDAVLVEGASQRLILAFTNGDRLGIVAPRVIDPIGRSRAASAGAEPSVRSTIGHFLMLGRAPLVGRWFSPLHLVDPNAPASPDWVSGAAMVVRRSTFESAGGFDERMFLYMEDVDLCRRFREAGWTIRYEPAAIVRHRIGGSQSADQAARWYRAYHQYLREREGGTRARLASASAALGLAARWAAYRIGRPANATRVGIAARAALALALDRPRPR